MRSIAKSAHSLLVTSNCYNACLHQAGRAERARLIAAGLLLLLAGPVADGIGLALVITVVAKQKLRKS